MSRTAEIANIVEELRHAADVMNMAADFIYSSFCTEEPDEPEAEEPKPVTLEEVRTLLANLSRLGFTDEVRGLLRKYGADKLSAVDPANYPALVCDAKELVNAG